ncbi:MAG: hypothetical protein PHQ78_05540 [Candidatus Cloacimonetes bacterium]|jgi:radical SAM superfamily enzyme YgiQ (UPF0313 family)|nr:hypothetical protein [Candidatus Cloacimonadota bacterium]
MAFFPVNKSDLNARAWSACDIILISGDAYVDHPSFGVPIIARSLEAAGFKVGIIAQPDWHNDADFMALGAPRLFFGISSGNMDSMVNHYTAQRRLRSDDAYSPEGNSGKRPDRAVMIYTNIVKRQIIPYIIIGHPGTTMDDALALKHWLEKHKIHVEQVQEFTPTPMTISTCMYYTGLDFETGNPIHIPSPGEIRKQKELIVKPGPASGSRLHNPPQKKA